MRDLLRRPRRPVDVDEKDYKVVAIEVGSNDLCEKYASAFEVAQSIILLARRIQQTTGIRRIVVFGILKRQRTCRWLEVPLREYNRRVDRVNRELHRCLERPADSLIRFAEHRGDARRLGRDGVHIDRRAMADYWRSVSAGVRLAVGDW